jgi:hypothetical protein
MMKLTSAIAAVLLWCGSLFAQSTDIENLQRAVEEQGRQLQLLQAQLAEMQQILSASAKSVPTVQPAVLRQAPSPARAAITTTPQTTAPAAIAGFRFSGDFRLRLDAAIRGASSQVTGLQNVRGRYRLRFNADREIASDLNFHLQLSTGAVNNGITLDQDLAGGVSRHPFLISEAYLDFRPRNNVSIRAGKQEEVFADNARFLWDDDVRFNGFSERVRFGKVEFRGGQYFFINPNVFNVAAGSPLAPAGVQPGTIARASQMYHQGFVVDAPINNRWKQQFTADIQLYRNPNLIALTSNATGVAATVNPGIGITVAGTAPGTGDATTSPSSAVLFAPHYQVARAVYRVDATQIGGNARLPLTWMAQASRNVGTSQLQDAVMSSISLGRTTQKGDVRGLYMFAIKDANSMISQLTDDDLGTGTGVNLATHHFRIDYTIRPNVFLQNLLFLQTQRRSSNPAASFFVPIGREAPRTWRYLGQIAIGF